MSNEDIVKKLHPHAAVETEKVFHCLPWGEGDENRYYLVWNKPESMVTEGDPWMGIPPSSPQCLLGTGRTAEEAWYNAAVNGEHRGGPRAIEPPIPPPWYQ